MATVGERIKAMRKARGWTLQRLEQESGVPAGRLSHLERGPNPAFRRSTAERLGKAFGVPWQEILTGLAVEGGIGAAEENARLRQELAGLRAKAEELLAMVRGALGQEAAA